MYKLIVDFLITIDFTGILFAIFRMVVMTGARFVSMFMFKRTYKYVKGKLKKESAIIIPDEQEVICFGANSLNNNDASVVTLEENTDSLQVFLNPEAEREQKAVIRTLIHKVSEGMEFLDKDEAVEAAYEECCRNLKLYGPDKGSPTMFFMPIALEYETSEIRADSCIL